MKTLNELFQDHLDCKVTTLAICWKITRRDGVIIRGTEHDSNIIVSGDTSDLFELAGTYEKRTGFTGSNIANTSDLSVDNLEVQGATDPTIFVDAAAIEGGLFDNAEVIIFMVNWQDPDQDQMILRRGNTGNNRRQAEGRYWCELRGLSQRLSQNFLRSFNSACDADLGDERCQFDLAAIEAIGAVSAVVSRRSLTLFVVNADENPLLLMNNYVGGKVTFTSGSNDGISREIKTATYDGDEHIELTFYEPFPELPEVGDATLSTPGCDKAPGTCKNVYDNLVNFQGYAIFAPTLTQTVAGPFEGSSATDLLIAWEAVRVSLFGE